MKDVKNMMEHLNAHQKYPASKAELVAECDNLSDFSAADKKWFEENLPDKSYDSAKEVAAALNMQERSAMM